MGRVIGKCIPLFSDTLGRFCYERQFLLVTSFNSSTWKPVFFFLLFFAFQVFCDVLYIQEQDVGDDFGFLLVHFCSCLL